jgi:transposase
LSKGGLTTKIHALCDADGKPTALMLTRGNASDLCGFDGLSSSIVADTLIGDKGYDADERVRGVLASFGKCAVIPPRRNRKTPADYDKERYKERHKIENFFSRLKDYRGIATRYDKTARNFLSGVYLAAAILWIN